MFTETSICQALFKILARSEDPGFFWSKTGHHHTAPTELRTLQLLPSRLTNVSHYILPS